jgi:cytochrome c-type biogenesis protein CcmE
MRVRKLRVALAVSLAILCLLLITRATNAQAQHTTVADILSNPDKFDGEMVQVEGNVTSLKIMNTDKGTPYHRFKLTDGDKSINVFKFGTPSIREGDTAMVIGRYQKLIYVGVITFYNEIDASGGSVEKIK